MSEKTAGREPAYAGDAAPYGVQYWLGRAARSAVAVRNDLRSSVREHLGEPDAVLGIDETGFLRKRTKSVGAAQQCSVAAGRMENCQIGVLLTYATGRGRTFLDREWSLPRA